MTQDSITIDEVSINLRSNNVWKFKYGDTITGWKALDVISDDTCFRQVINVQHKTEDEFNNLEIKEAFVVKPHVTRRTLDLVGLKAQTKVKLIEFITSNTFLMKFKGYWSVLDTEGQIQELPNDLAKALHKRPFTNISTKRLPHSNKTMLILEHPTLIISVLINHRGQVCEVNEYP